MGFPIRLLLLLLLLVQFQTLYVKNHNLKLLHTGWVP